jgi:hypothetical protein
MEQEWWRRNCGEANMEFMEQKSWRILEAWGGI